MSVHRQDIASLRDRCSTSLSNRTNLTGAAMGASQLLRSKSASSELLRPLRTNNENMRPSPNISLEYTALVAANTAFGMVGEPRPPPLKHDRRRGDLTSSEKSSQGVMPHSLRAKRSVRFTGPRAVGELKRPITCTQVAVVPPAKSKASDREKKGSEYSVSAAVKQCASETGDGGLSQRSSQYSNLTALPSLTSNSTTPKSSYKRLKKAKSLFNPRREKPEYFAHAVRVSTEDSRFPTAAPRLIAPTGFSPGRPRPTAEQLLAQLPNPHQTSYNQDAAVKLARDQFLRDLELQRLKEANSASVIDASSEPASRQKSFRTTVRTSSGHSFAPAVGSEMAKLTKNQGPSVVKTRKSSWNIRDRFKRVFGRSESRSIPAQQIDAQRAHFGNCAPFDFETTRTISDIPMPDPALISRVNSRASSIAQFPIPTEPRQRAPSLESIESAQSQSDALRSRVTSWSNSTITSNITTRKMHAAENNRLSIIQENGGPHQPSRAASSTYGSGRLGYAAFRRPIKAGHHLPGQLDNKRLFSALQKRINQKDRSETEDDGCAEEDEKSASERGPLPASLQIGSRSTSSDTQKTARSARSTIRFVNDGSTDIKKGLQTIRSSRSFNLGYQPSNSTDDVFRPSRNPSGESHRSRSGGLSYQQIAEENERPLEQNNTLTKRGRYNNSFRESKSAFFPPQKYYAPEKPSPFRKSMERVSLEQERPPLTSLGYREEAGPAKELPSGRPSLDSCSVYSRETTAKPLLTEPIDHRKTLSSNKLFITKRGSSNDRATGSIAARGPPTFINTGSAPNQQRPVLNSSRSFTREPYYSSRNPSDEWKGWMASQVAKLEKGNEQQMTLNDPSSCAGKPTKHRREYAQIHDGDELEDLLVPKETVSNTAKPTMHRREFAQIHDGHEPIDLLIPKESASHTGNWTTHRRDFAPIHDGDEPGDQLVPKETARKSTMHRREFVQTHDGGEPADLAVPKKRELRPTINKRRPSPDRPRHERVLSDQQAERNPLRYPLIGHGVSNSYSAAMPSRIRSPKASPHGGQVPRENPKPATTWGPEVPEAPTLIKRASEPILKARTTHRRVLGSTTEGAAAMSASQTGAAHEQLREKPMNGSSPERTARLRRMQSSGVLTGSNSKDNDKALSTSRWARNQQENHALGKLSPLGRFENSPRPSLASTVDCEDKPGGGSGSKMVELFLSTRRGGGETGREGSGPPPPAAFI